MSSLAVRNTDTTRGNFPEFPCFPLSKPPIACVLESLCQLICQILLMHQLYRRLTLDRLQAVVVGNTAIVASPPQSLSHEYPLFCQLRLYGTEYLFHCRTPDNCWEPWQQTRQQPQPHSRQGQHVLLLLQIGAAARARHPPERAVIQFFLDLTFTTTLSNLSARHSKYLESLIVLFLYSYRRKLGDFSAVNCTSVYKEEGIIFPI